MRQRYHRDLGFPAGAPLRPPTELLILTGHAAGELRKDNILASVPRISSDASCIELTLNDDGSVWRWVLRQRHDAKRDLVMVVEADGTVVTCWTNHKDDHHKTLRRELYTIPAGLPS